MQPVDAVCDSYYFTVGGIRQWVHARGASRKNPLLLILHAGPGLPSAGLVDGYQALLEDRFVVIHWDQRGTGKSFSLRRILEPMCINAFVDDAEGVARQLLRRYEQARLFLMGISWGSLVGLRLLHRHPELIAGFAGTGQFTQTSAMESASYAFALQKANEAGHRSAIRQLHRIGQPPYGRLGALMTQRKWLYFFGGGTFGEVSNKKSFQVFIRGASIYSFLDKIRMVLGTLISLKRLLAEINTVNLSEEISSVKVPVYFFQGKHDFVTPTPLVQAFCANLDAPRKEVVVFDHSCHDVVLTEPARFQNAVIEKLLGP